MTDGEEREGTAVRGDRFSGGPARAFLSSLDTDERLFAADIAVDRAHVVMLAEQEIIPAADAAAILGALDDVESAGHGALPAGEDVHEAIESAVIDRIGTVGGKLHTARSRNDEVATCIRYRLREDVIAAIEATIELRAVLADVAEAEVETIMPGFTHLQAAQPTTVAHWALSYEGAVGRDTARLQDAYDRLNRSPLGAAAFAGTPFDVDRDRTASLLGFDGPVVNATDAVAGRDVLFEATAALAAHATTLAGLATDLITFASRGYVTIADDYASTSSIMPQKKNPDTLELVRARSGDALAGVAGLATVLKGLPRAYNRDLQRAHGHAFTTVDAVTAATTVSAGALATATWPTDVLAAAAADGFATATGVADLLASEGVPFRQAHAVVATAAETGGDVAAIEAAAEQVLDEPLAAYVDTAAVEAALDPARSVASRDSLGGPAPAAVREQLPAVTEAIEADRTTTTNREAALSSAADRLAEVVGTYG